MHCTYCTISKTAENYSRYSFPSSSSRPFGGCSFVKRPWRSLCSAVCSCGPRSRESGKQAGCQRLQSLTDVKRNGRYALVEARAPTSVLPSATAFLSSLL